MWQGPTYAAQLGAAFCDEWPLFYFVSYFWCPMCDQWLSFFSNKTLLFHFILDGACGADAKVRAWMDQVAHSAVAKEPAEAEAGLATGETSSSAKSMSSTDGISSGSPFLHSEAEHNRSRRAANYYHNYRMPNYEAAGRISYRYSTLESSNFGVNTILFSL